MPARSRRNVKYLDRIPKDSCATFFWRQLRFVFPECSGPCGSDRGGTVRIQSTLVRSVATIWNAQVDTDCIAPYPLDRAPPAPLPGSAAVTPNRFW